MALLINIPPTGVKIHGDPGDDKGPDYYVNIGLAMCLMGSTRYVITIDEYDVAQNGNGLPSGWQALNAGGGSQTQPANATGGVVRNGTGAAGNANSQMYNQGGIVGRPDTQKWYVAVYASIDTGIDSVGYIVAGLIDNALTKTIAFGAALNNVNFGVQYDGSLNAGSFLDTGTPLDTNKHIFEMAGRGDSKVYARIDGGAIVSATMSAAANLSHWRYVGARSGATLANRQRTDDWMLTIGQRF